MTRYMKASIATALMFAASVVCALAQQSPAFPDTSSPPKVAPGFVIGTLNASGQFVPSSNTQGVATAPITGTPTQATVTCGNTSTQLLAASAAGSFIRVSVPPGGSTVWFNWAGAAAVAATPSDPITAGNAIWWTTYVPTSVINCIVASGSQAVTVISK